MILLIYLTRVFDYSKWYEESDDEKEEPDDQEEPVDQEESVDVPSMPPLEGDEE